MRYTLFATIAFAVLLSSCTDKKKEDAQNILKQAQEQFERGEYGKTLSLIDSLRHAHPEAIEERKKALALFQDASEKMAQKMIEENDQAIQTLESEIATLGKTVAEHKQKGTATATELMTLTKKQVKLDSLKARFEAQCATVKVIRERRKSGK